MNKYKGWEKLFYVIAGGIMFIGDVFETVGNVVEAVRGDGS